MKTKDSGSIALLSECGVNRRVAEWLTGGDGMCPIERLYSEGLQADIHSFRGEEELIVGGDIFAAYVIFRRLECAYACMDIQVQVHTAILQLGV